jgi:hypothetical protein
MRTARKKVKIHGGLPNQYQRRHSLTYPRQETKITYQKTTHAKTKGHKYSMSGMFENNRKRMKSSNA